MLFWFPAETICPIALFELGGRLLVREQPLFVGTNPNYQRRLDVEVQLRLARPEVALVGQERESWRLWLTNRLAVALLAARRDGGPLEPWQYALARLEIDGIDPSTWAPSADLWEEAA